MYKCFRERGVRMRKREVLLFQKSILHFVISAVSSRRNTLWYGPLELKIFKILKFKLEAWTMAEVLV